jgi:NB-ARC domain.
MKSSKFLWIILLIISSVVLAKPAINNLPSRNSNFIGREGYLDSISRTLDKRKIAYVVGYGGVGKTQLAREYGHLNRDKYDIIWWFDANSNIVPQYEMLLGKLKKDSRFSGLLRNTKLLSPQAVVEVTNLALANSNSSWLLIFDDVKDNDNKAFVMPKPMKDRQNILVTSRKSNFLELDTISVHLFTEVETEGFFKKVHQVGNKGQLSRLVQLSHNYPLALGQISDEISLYYLGDVEAYLKYHNGLYKKTDNYKVGDVTGSYHEVLSSTLKSIENENQRAMALLYMLSLLKVNFSEDSLLSLFGNAVIKDLAVLVKYGVIKVLHEEKGKRYVLHDVMIEKVLVKFATLNANRASSILRALTVKIKRFYANLTLTQLIDQRKYFEEISLLYAFVEMALEKNCLSSETVDLIILALRLDNLLFSKYSDYLRYQRIGGRVYDKNIDHLGVEKKALLYANLIFMDSIMSSEKEISEFEQRLLSLERSRKKKLSSANLFVFYTQVAQFYLLLGDLDASSSFLAKAKFFLEKNTVIMVDQFSLLQYWYTRSWLCCELRDLSAGIEAVKSFIELGALLGVGELSELFASNLKINFMILEGEPLSKCKQDLDLAMKKVNAYYNNERSDISGELEFTKARVFLLEGQLEQASQQCYKALKILGKIFGGDDIDITQANIYLMLGKIHRSSRNYLLASTYYARALKYYEKFSSDRPVKFYAYGELLLELSMVNYEQNDIGLARQYYRSLVAKFGLDHELIRDRIKELPKDFIYRLGDGNIKQ